MTNTTHISPERVTRKNQSDWTSSRRKAENDEDRGSPEFPMIRDACSPSDSAAPAQYDGESLDFGDAGVDLI
jgi:hypothetical protein